MDESNHEMDNMLTQQIDTMFNRLIQSTNESYKAIATEIVRIACLFSPPQPVYQRISLNPNITTSL